MGEHAFQAEVGRVLSLVINSLYSNKEIFLRELVSNASDALDKLRFRSITEPALLEGEPALVITLRADRERGVLVIEDTGIGMTEAELVDNLGTVARSGSIEFLKQLEQNAHDQKGDEQNQQAEKKGLSLIGQFGVGFYSAYLVADRVEVTSRAAAANQAWRWSSSGKDTFSIEPAERSARGTSIELTLKVDQKHLLDEWTLRDLVRRYSDYIAYPIEFESVKEGKATREVLNQANALWQRPKSEITDEQYEELYRHLTHAPYGFEGPLARTHFRLEGTVEAVGLLWLPKSAPFDLDDPRSQRGMKLFVKRVLVMDDCDALAPQWLRFVRGLVDAEDLPLNVSRELLQESSTLRTIKKQVTKHVVDLLDEIANSQVGDYQTFWGAFGRILKEGLVVDAEWKDRIAKLTRWSSTRGTDLVSLGEYVAAMKEDQNAIYYITGESRPMLEGSPYIEAICARGYEVLLMTDAVDTWAADAIAEFDGKKLVNAMRADVPLPNDNAADNTNEAAKNMGPLIEIASKALEGKVKSITTSTRLLKSPACLVLTAGAMPAHLENALRHAGKQVARGSRQLEVNPAHPVVDKLAALAKANSHDERLGEWVTVLYEQALLAEGSPIDDPIGFAKRLTDLLGQAVGI
ncbi:MAG: molecular chaperone HtpG [Polyangiaceae bacterium]|nr:molecular chaperone HtpG [Polyangiaceae bacterium]